MKRLISFVTFLAVAVMVVLVATSTVQTASADTTTSLGEAYVISRNVSIRTSPNESATVIKSGRNGEIYDVVAENGSWYNIRLDDGSYGYALSCYFVLNPKLIFLCEGAPVYAAPSITNKRVGYVTAGELFVVIAETDNYYIVNLRMAAGYISKNTDLMTSEQIDWYLAQTPVSATIINTTEARVSPDSRYKSLRRYNTGEKVTVYAIQGDYYAISYMYDEKTEIVAFVRTADVTID